MKNIERNSLNKEETDKFILEHEGGCRTLHCGKCFYHGGYDVGCYFQNKFNYKEIGLVKNHILKEKKISEILK